MGKKIKFGIRIPAFPLSYSRGGKFRDEILDYLVSFEVGFDSVWVADHFIPWHEPQDPMTTHWNAGQPWRSLLGSSKAMISAAS